MEKQNYLNDIKKRHYAILFKIISQCNDFCDFCLEYEFIKSGRPPLNLAEIKKNYFYLKKRFKTPDYVILTGGEPTLHPQFFEILDFLKGQRIGFRFITNLLKLNEPAFSKKLKPYFKNFKNERQRNLTKIIASINDLPSFSPVAKKRIAGLKKLLQGNFPLMITVVIYNSNLKYLGKLATYLKNLFKKSAPDKPLHVEFRCIYIEGTSKPLLKKTLPRDFHQLKKTIEKVLDILDSPRVKVTLWNFPLCYLADTQKAQNEAILERQKRYLIKIHKDAQLNHFEIRDWEDYLKPHQECQNCKLKDLCSGIDRRYIKEYNFPKLTPM